MRKYAWNWKSSQQGRGTTELSGSVLRALGNNALVYDQFSADFTIHPRAAYISLALIVSLEVWPVHAIKEHQLSRGE